MACPHLYCRLASFLGLLQMLVTGNCTAFRMLRQILYVSARKRYELHTWWGPCTGTCAKFLSKKCLSIPIEISYLPMQVCWTWCWFAELAAVALFLLYRIGAVKVRELRRDLHEEKYLVGRQLNNLIRSHAISASTGGEGRPTPDVPALMHAPASDP